MIRSIIWKIFGFIFQRVIKPVMFLIPPDKTHEDAIKIAAFIGRSKFLNWLTRAVFKTRNRTLEQDIDGLHFYSPVGLSAGFDKNGEVVAAMSNLGFGFGEVGSITAEMCLGNPRPWFYRLPNTKSLVVNAGLANQGSTAILRRLKDNAKFVNIKYVTFLSIAKANDKDCVTVKQGLDDYMRTLNKVKKNKYVGAVELNISCPNTYGGEPFTVPENLLKLLKSVDKLGIKQPIYVKLPSNLAWKAVKKLTDIIVEYKLAGVTVANLSKTRENVNSADKFPAEIQGSLSGMPVQDKSDYLIKKIYREYGGRLTIIGVGGIFSPEDAYRKIRLGASLVEFITGMIFVGPQLSSEINYGLKKFLKRDGFSHISEAVGVDARK